MAEDNIVQKVKRWKPMSKRPIGRPKTRWKDDVLEDIKSINISNWKKVAKNRDSWKKVVKQARTLYSLQRFIRRRFFKGPKLNFKFGRVSCRIVMITVASTCFIRVSDLPRGSTTKLATRPLPSQHVLICDL